MQLFKVIVFSTVFIQIGFGQVYNHTTFNHYNLSDTLHHYEWEILNDSVSKKNLYIFNSNDMVINYQISDNNHREKFFECYYNYDSVAVTIDFDCGKEEFWWWKIVDFNSATKEMKCIMYYPVRKKKALKSKKGKEFTMVGKALNNKN